MTGRYSLDPEMPVLLRPDDAVQIGWDPRRAVLVRPPRGMTAGTLASLLRTRRADIGVDDVVTEVRRLGGAADPGEIAELMTALVRSRVAHPVLSPRSGAAGRAAAIRVHGSGPLSELLVDGLRCSGARISHTTQPHARMRPHNTDLVVLADALVADPRLVADMQRAGVAHLPVRVRDGTGLVGPLVIPGVTSCLHCADLHRCDRDAAWPAVAAQLRNTVGTADRATLLATAALALGQVDAVIKVVRVGSGTPAHLPAPLPPPTLSTTLEVDARAGTIVAKRWSWHPGCPCRG